VKPRLRFWGVRGSFPSAHPNCRVLGGNTACLQLEWLGQSLIIDAGTGIRSLGKQLLGQGAPLHLLISHPHWDHIQGLPHFAPLYCEGTRLHVHSLQRAVKLRSLLESQQSGPFCATPLGQLPCQLSFQEWEEGQCFRVGDFEVEAWRLNHPGTCSGFRIRCGEFVFAYVSDVAPSQDYLLADPWPGQPPRQQALEQLYENQLRLMDRADAVVYDTFFTAELYAQRSHWGHSTLEQALEAAERAGARHLFMFHHNSELSDHQQQRRLDKAKRPAGLSVELAREGDQWALQPGLIHRCA
jgi:phosphoribosyl 1,2-cyclic phosphodiesterase